MYGYAASFITAGVTVAALGPGIVGSRAHQIPEDEQVGPLLGATAKQYAAAELKQKFRISFIRPIVGTAEHSSLGGGGILGDGTFKTASTEVGRSCLRGSAFDTTPYNGKASAVGTFEVDGNKVSVHPAGSNARPLVFHEDAEGYLDPTPRTADTLQGNGCHYLGGIPVRESFTVGDVPSWTYVGPLQTTLDQQLLAGQS